MLEEGYFCIRDLIAGGVDLEPFLDLEFAEIDGKLCDFVSARRQHFAAFRSS